eukprot:TRINITY_DN1818_c0_g2_i1.p1 TRINITY_DN1818_c0_g2~~TRINITY_DN1818_c0_g2_i1.p1  ORF type:complete len:321 (-),score=35.61 TRINITY_DN1818_c0_g2_i1:41-1003(-)
MKPTLLIFALFLISSVRGTTLYAVVTESRAQFSQFSQFIVTINPSTGTFSNVVETFIYASGSSTTVNGISTFDDKRGVYYYATDSITSWVYEANVRTKNLLPPISFEVDQVSNLNFDDLNGRLIATVESKLSNGQSQANILAFPVNQQTPIQTIFTLPPTINTGFVMATTFDSNTQTYYILAQTTNATGPDYSISVISNNSIFTNKLKCQNPYFGQYLAYDSSAGLFYATGLAYNENQFYFVSFDLQGNCEQYEISIKDSISSAIITCSAYDPSSKSIYYGVSTSVGGFIYSFDIKNKTLQGVVLGSGAFTPESLEISQR